MAKVMASPEAAAAKWQRNTAGASDAIKQGVMAVTQAPGQKAAAAKDLWLANVNASAGRWATAVGNVSLQDWQNAIINKGIPRITQGAAQAQGKVQAFLQSWLPFQQQVVAGLPARGGLEQNIQRMEQLVRKNAEAKGKFRQAGRSR